MPDLRGFGESGLPAGNGVGTLTMEALADDLHGLLHAVFVDGPVVLCGLSMGGYIAWQFFQKYRSQLKALILCDTRAAADTPEGAAGRLKLAEQVLAQGSAGASRRNAAAARRAENARTASGSDGRPPRDDPA